MHHSLHQEKFGTAVVSVRVPALIGEVVEEGEEEESRGERSLRIKYGMGGLSNQ